MCHFIEGVTAKKGHKRVFEAAVDVVVVVVFLDQPLNLIAATCCYGKRERQVILLTLQKF